MTAPRSPEGRRPAAELLQMRRLGQTCALMLTLIALVAVEPRAQSAPAGGPLAVARAAAEKAFRAGRYEEVEAIAAPHGSDEALVVLRARALVARGEHARAEDVLKPAASAAPTGNAALELGILHTYLGRRNEARRGLSLVLLAQPDRATAADYARAARASKALGRFEEANGLFREAVALSPNDPAINTAWGELFLEKHNRQDAARSFEAALAVDKTYAPAQLGMARAITDENPPAAAALARQVLEANPNDVAALLFLAESEIDEDKKATARETLARARNLNPNSLEAHALEAALAFVEGRDDDHSASVAAALAINPLYGEAHRVVGAVAARFYRFDEAADQARKAIAIDRDLARAHADLGAHLMRTGDERNARRSLELAFRADPYDVITYNLLSLLDTLEQFETFRDGDLVVKLHRDEAPVMREYAPALARQALDSLSERWQFTPKGPILIELFPRHDDFAVRNVGLPGMIGALGACFGRVVTLDSPQARPPGTFNWGATLWHEMAHVITLQLSNQRIPRWLTEGISVFEETRARPEWGREMEVPFAQALEAGGGLKLADLNAGFQNPETISIAYYQASLLVEHIVAAYGEPKLRALVESFAAGIDTPEALRKVLGVEMPALQATFDTFLDQRFSALRAALRAPGGFTPDLPLDKLRAVAAANPGSFPVQMSLGEALRETDPAAAIEAFERAAKAVPMATGEGSPYGQIVEIARAGGDKARAARALAQLTAYDHTDLESARQLAALSEEARDNAQLQTALERVVAVDPFDSAAHTSLGRLQLAGGKPRDAVRMFRVALAAGPRDRAGAHVDLAEGLIATGDSGEARRQLLTALEIAPTYSRAQDLLLKLTEGGH